MTTVVSWFRHVKYLCTNEAVPSVEYNALKCRTINELWIENDVEESGRVLIRGITWALAW
jgi:hypothetical protein